MFRGALYTIHPSHRANNPDWMAQAAHSLRDVLYPFYGRGASIKGEDAFVQYGAAGNIDALAKEVRKYFGFLTSVAHHNWDEASSNPIAKALNVSGTRADVEIFQDVVFWFENILYRVLRRQLDAHVEIDKFIADGANDAALLRDLLAVNFDARRYFFRAADERLFDWLRASEFLNLFPKAVTPDASGISYGTPELDYLVKIAASRPDKIVDFMLETPVIERSSLEVVDHFLWICQDLPAAQMARVVPKLRDEKWIARVAGLNRSGFAYRRMFQTLRAAKDDTAERLKFLRTQAEQPA